MWTLAIECSSAQGSVALAAPGQPPWSANFVTGRGCGGLFFAALQEAVRAVGNDALDAIVVGLGPGSYSGVRQAIAAAIGLSFAREAALLGVPSTAALETEAAEYHALGDARRGGLYYTAVLRGECVVGPELIDRDTALERLASQPHWPALAESALEGLPVTEGIYPSAARLLTVPVATRKVPPLEPIYLRDPAITLPRARGLICK